MSYIDDNTLSNTQSSFDDDDDSSLKAEQVIRLLRNTNILELTGNQPGSSRFDNKAYQDQMKAKRIAVKFIENAKDKPQAFWQVFEAVYSWIRYDEWLQKYHLDGAEVSFNKLMCRLEDVLGLSRKGQSEFLSSRRRDFQERKAFNPVKEYFQKVAIQYPVNDADAEAMDADALWCEDEDTETVKKPYVPVHPQVMPEWKQLAKLLFGAEDELSQNMLESWFRGAVARAVNPGCKMDNVLILKSAQGKAKTTFFEILGGDYFIQSSDPTSVETIRLLQKGWVCELGELEGITRKSDVELFKHFVTKRKDDLRIMHTEDIPEKPRHVVFGGTCNSNEILKDTTGNRRFMVVPVVQKIPTQWLTENRDRLWASAYHSYMFYKSHEKSHDMKWWFTDEMVEQSEERNQEYMERSQYEDRLEMLLAFLENRWIRQDVDGIGFTLPDLMESGLGIAIRDQKTGRQDVKIAKLLEDRGYQKKKSRVLGALITQWKKPGVSNALHLTQKELAIAKEQI
jgi:hypothetical protein